MDKRKTKKQSAKATLAEVIKEMAKPRVAKSAREQSSVFSRNEVLVVENNVEKGTVNLQPALAIVNKA
jgi:hypothetical protein